MSELWAQVWANPDVALAALKLGGLTGGLVLGAIRIAYCIIADLRGQRAQKRGEK